MHSRHHIPTLASLLAAALCMACLWMGAPAAAQSNDPDIRNLQPFVMVIVDTSGSMEWLPNCNCTTPSCLECLPDCTLANTAGVPPTGNTHATGKKNRWAFT